MTIDKRKIHHWWRMLRRIKTWHLLLVLLLLIFVSLELLRENNLGMIERRNVVKMADEQNGDIQKALQDLQHYVSGHMNTDMGDKGVYLEHTYQRAYNRAVQQGLQDDSASRALYEQADAECQPIFRSTQSFPAYTVCVAEKLAPLTGSDPMASVAVPSVDLYRYNFVSPLWSPDPAGWAVLTTAALAIILLGRFILFWLFYLLLKQRRN